MAGSMPGILSGISGAGAVPGTSNGFGWPDSTFPTGLNLPFKSDTGAPPGRNLTGLGMPGSQFFAARQPKYIDGEFFIVSLLSLICSTHFPLSARRPAELPELAGALCAAHRQRAE
jgi:hypothetical protein